MPRDEFNDLLQESFVVDSETMIHAANLAVRLGVAVIDALEILMRIGVLLGEENIPPGTSNEEETDGTATMSHSLL